MNLISKLIIKFLATVLTKSSAGLEIHENLIGSICGIRSATINKLRSQYKCNICISHINESNWVTVTISSESRSIRAVVAEMHRLVYEEIAARECKSLSMG